jgi:type VI secretion system protein ImpK
MHQTSYGPDDSPDLPGLCSDFLMLIMQIRITRQLDDPATLRARVKDLLSRLDSKARAAGVEFEQLEYVKFALVAFLDEAITGIDFADKDTWLASPLQMELYNRYDAGEEFFKRLQQLRQRPQANLQALEIYYHCLVAGFKGKYHNSDPEALRGLIEDIRAEIFRYRETRIPQTLSPHGKPQEGVLEVVSKDIPAWVIGVVAVALGVLFFIVMTFFIEEAADDTVRTIHQVISSASCIPFPTLSKS